MSNLTDLKLDIELWGGLIEILYKNCTDLESIPKKIRILVKKLLRLQKCKTIEDIYYSLHFTKKQKDYLNSPLLDEIFETIFENRCPITYAIIYKKNKAAKFYYERITVNPEDLIFLCIHHNNSEMLKIFLQIDIDYKKIYYNIKYNSKIEKDIIKLLEEKDHDTLVDSMYKYLDTHNRSLPYNHDTIKNLFELGLIEKPEDVLKFISTSYYSYTSRIVIEHMLEKIEDISINDYEIVKKICSQSLYYFTVFKRYNFKENNSIILYLKNNFDTFDYEQYILPYVVS